MPWDKLTNALWNVIFTFFPILLLGLFDQPVAAEYLMKYPQLYRSGQRNDFVRAGGHRGVGGSGARGPPS